MSGMQVDTAQRERVERELLESEQRFRSVVENLQEAVMITDEEDRIILANSRVKDVLGYDISEVIGKVASDLLLPPESRHVFRERLRKRLEGESEVYEVELVRQDGTRIFAEVSASPYRDASGRIVGTLGAVSDISERKRLEERLRNAMRIEAVGQLAGGVAHDFNNLLTIIKCHTELIKADLGAEHHARADVREIEGAIGRAAALTQQLLAYSRKLLLQPRRVVLHDLLEDVTPMLRRTLAPNVTLTIRSEAGAGTIHADPMKLEYVLSTLTRNASDAMPDGGTVTIRACTIDVSNDATMGTNEMSAGRYAVITVADSGVGMTPAVRERVFQPFFTTKGPGEGSGLGLASAYGIVRQSGGFIEVESAQGVGTTFRIYLPLMPAGAPAALQS